MKKYLLIIFAVSLVATCVIAAITPSKMYDDSGVFGLFFKGTAAQKTAMPDAHWTAAEGDQWYDTTVDKLKIYSGSAWDVALIASTATDAGRGLSPTLWDDCPVGIEDPQSGFSEYHTYAVRWGGAGSLALGTLTGTSTTEIEDWIQTEVTTGLTVKSEVDGGVLRVSSEGSASADDGLCVMYRSTAYIPADTKTIWFEARVALTDIDATQDTENMYFIGLADTITSAIPSGVVDDTVDKIGFYHHDGGTTATLSFITADGSVQEETAGAATGLVDATYVKLGFKCVYVGAAGTVTPYVNGVAGTTHVTEASLPIGTGMGVCLSATSEGTSIAIADVDWVKVAQSN